MEAQRAALRGSDGHEQGRGGGGVRRGAGQGEQRTKNRTRVDKIQCSFYHPSSFALSFPGAICSTRIARRTITYLPSPFDKVINELRVVYISSLLFPEPKLPKWELFFTYFPSLHHLHPTTLFLCPEIGMGERKGSISRQVSEAHYTIFTRFSWGLESSLWEKIIIQGVTTERKPL